MRQIGLWQQGKIGPFLPISTTFADNDVIEVLTEYLNVNFNQIEWSSHGIVYIPEVKSFFFIWYDPRKDSDYKFIKSYTVLVEISINDHFVAFFHYGRLNEKIGSVLNEIKNLDKEERYEDIVSYFNKFDIDQLLDVEKSKEGIKVVDSMTLLNYPQIYSIFAYLLNMDRIYLLFEDDKSVDNILHLLNLFIGEITDVREYIHQRGFSIIGIEKFDDQFIEARKKNFVIVKSHSLKIETELGKNIHHEKLDKFKNLTIEEKVLQIKGYIAQVISQYFQSVRELAVEKNSLSKSHPHYTAIKRLSIKEM